MQVIFLTKDILTIPQEVAHLYEHWLIMSYYTRVEQQYGVNGGVVGYVSGETYKNIMFIEAWIYDTEAARLCERSMLEEHLDERLLETCMQQCAAEDRETWKISDRTLLMEQIEQLRQLPWQQTTDLKLRMYEDEAIKKPSPIKLHKTAAAYRAITITITLRTDDIADKAVFQRLHIIIDDVIGQYIQEKGWYRLDSLGVTEKPDATDIYTMSGVSLLRGGLTNRQIETDITDYLRQIDVAAHMKYIRAHMDEFAGQPLWQGRLRDDLHHVGIIASNQQIAELTSQQRAARIFNSAIIAVKTVPFVAAQNL